MQNHNRRFTDDEFEIMIEQLIIKKPASFEMLYEIVERTLHGWVIAECRKYDVLRKRRLEEDIYHDVQVRMIQKTVTDFLLRQGADGEVNRNPDGFKSWMFRVADNLIKDSARKAGNNDYRFHVFGDGEEDSIADTESQMEYGSLFISEERIVTLKDAVSVVLNSKSQPYIVLTWLAMCVYMFAYDCTKIKSNHRILEDFFDKSLNEMFYTLNEKSEMISWLVLTEDQILTMMTKLDKIYDGEKTYGETSYRDFFMKKEPLSTISDWENRMNSLVKRVIKT